MISAEKVKHIVALARLALSKEEEKKFQKELSLVLDYIVKLEEVEIKGVSPTTGGSGAENVRRADQERPAEATAAEMLAQAPEKKGNFIKVRRIL